MKEPELKEWGCRLLEDQLTRLSELRNANPRDAGFKLWRQTTLTVVQRVWPGNLQRSERFRRIPFTAPGAKPSPAQVRDSFEKGCAEAGSYLQGLIADIMNGALEVGTEPASAQAAGAAPAPTAPPMTAPTSAPTPPAPAPAATHPRATRSDAKAERPGLKEMLGFGEPKSPAKASPPLDPLATEPPVPAFSGPAALDVAPAPEETWSPPGSGLREGAAEPAGGSPAVATEAVRISPTVAAEPREAWRGGSKPVWTSPTAAALVALASEVAILGVPEGQRAGARAALTDLARRLEDRSASWTTLRDAIAFVMEHPPLARRVVPLLVPYLDLGA